jgi:anti-anti-sigma factor
MNRPDRFEVTGGSYVHATVNGSTVTVHVQGRFDFSCHPGFRQACASFGKARAYVVDLANTDYLDSSALGMLLVLREEVGADNVAIVGCQPAVRRILQIANFHTLFKLV